MLSGKNLSKNNLNNWTSCERNNMRNEKGVLAHLFRWTVYQTQLAYSWYPAVTRENFLSRREKTLKRCVCYSVSLSKGGWEAERGLRMENGENTLMWQGRWSVGRERTEIVCVCVNQDTVSRQAWSIYLDFLFCKSIPNILQLKFHVLNF